MFWPFVGVPLVVVCVRSQRMKIAVVTRDSVGGICRYSHELAVALASQGAEVFLIGPRDFPVFQGSSYNRVTVLPVVQVGLRGRIGRYLRKLGLLIENVIQPVRALRFCRAHSIQAVHFSNGFHFGFFVWRWFIGSRQVLGLSVHDVSRSSDRLIAGVMSRQLDAVYRRMSLLFVHDADAVKFLEARTRCGHLAALVVPHGVYAYPRNSPGRLPVVRKAGVKTGLFFGAVRDEKRLGLLLDALSRRRDRLDWRLLVAGSTAGGQHRPLSFYRERVSELGISRQVEFHEGYIADEEIHQFFEVADWVALVYGASFSSQSGVLATSVFFRVPVLTSGAPLLAKTVLEYGIGRDCPDDDPAVVLEGIEWLEARRSEDFEVGFGRFTEETSWGRNAKITLDAYRCALNGGMGEAGSGKVA
jgi:glycosyltransferase involved in cell wall biosynthesis